MTTAQAPRQALNQAGAPARSVPTATGFKAGLATRIAGACCALAVTANLLALIAGYALPATEAAPQQLAAAASATPAPVAAKNLVR